MKVLLVSEDRKVQNQTIKVLSNQGCLEVVSFNELNDKTCWDYDVIIIDFDKLKVSNKDFDAILKLKCEGSIPILALLEDSSVLDQFEVLALGAVDYLELPVSNDIYMRKLQNLYKWKWFYNWEKKNSLSNKSKE